MSKKNIKNRKKLLMDLIGHKDYQPMRAKDIAALLQVPKGKRKELFDLLDELVSEGKIVCRDARYEKVRRSDKKEKTAKQEKSGKSGSPETWEGVFIANAKGFGFVEVDGQEEDFYIAEEDTLHAFHKDRVKVQVRKEKSGGRREGRIIKILEHGMTEVTGTFEKSGNFGFVVPDNRKIPYDIFIAKENIKGAFDQDKVVVKLLSYGSAKKSPEGKVIEILGAKGEPGIDVLSIAKSSGLPMEFSTKVINQAERVPEHVIEGDFQGRMDLRSWTVVTIDGEDAKDLDDGISLTKEGDTYHLGVHIADVSNYVQGRSALDREALKRGTSVYLVDRVIPMLPQRLSNGICSLNQGEDRLALSCLMDIDKNGTLLSHRIVETVICVNRRMTYTSVQAILNQDEEEKRKYAELVPLFFRMFELSQIIRKNRERRGAIDFDFPESKVYLDEMGRPVKIKAYEQNDATRIIEDFMLMANETVAQEFCEKRMPFLYRTHETPDSDRIEKVLSFIRSQNIKAGKQGQEITPLEVQRILASIEGEPEEAMISRMMLRSMKQAKYTTDCIGHFGLAAKYYCHFTSPIRRYPDLQIHRIIKETLRGRMTEERKQYYAGILGEVAEQTSMLERRAEETERETIKLKKAEYMSYHIGERFEGTISGITGWGLYVELPDTVEGLVHVSSMRDDYYVYDEEKYLLYGEKNHKTYRLGDTVNVIVSEVDIDARSIDFILD